jgi:hypothetical protein
MDMKTIKDITYKIFILVIAACVVTSCKDDAEQDLKLQRMFEPAVFDIKNGETSVVIAWDRALFSTPGEVQYQIDLSKTADFSTIELSKTTPDPSLTLNDTDIDIRVDYFARVKAIGMNSAEDSNWLVSEAFRITGELFIQPVMESDVLATSAIIHWKEGSSISKIVLTPITGAPVEVAVADEDNAVTMKNVEDLVSAMNYSVELFAADGVSKGATNFVTKPSYDGANIVDLTAIVKPSILADTLPDIPSGSVVLLMRGQTYVISAALSLDRSVTITSAPAHIEMLASIQFESNFNLVENSAVDSVVFKDLNLNGHYASTYVFNINKAGTIGKVRFENCRGHAFRGFFRLQTGGAGTQVGDFYMNNCVVDSLRDFSLVNSNNSNTVANIKVTNTTIYNARKVIDHRSPGSNRIEFTNCTFYNLPSGGAAGGPSVYFIDLDTQNTTDGIWLTNCIFAKSWDDLALGNDARGIRMGTATFVTTTNSYALSDFVSTNETYKIPGVVAYPGSSTAVFTAPAAGNFTIKDASFPGVDNAGDPRWRLQ